MCDPLNANGAADKPRKARKPQAFSPGVGLIRVVVRRFAPHKLRMLVRRPVVAGAKRPRQHLDQLPGRLRRLDATKYRFTGPVNCIHSFGDAIRNRLPTPFSSRHFLPCKMKIRRLAEKGHRLSMILKNPCGTLPIVMFPTLTACSIFTLKSRFQPGVSSLNSKLISVPPNALHVP